jgi:diguanylate cyclase (GGDEF)-like protein
MVRQADVLLQAVRAYYLHTKSVEETERFIDALSFDREFVENIYLIDRNGLLLIPSSKRLNSPNATRRDYFLFHQGSDQDQLHIGPVTQGLVTGKQQFRLTRRVNDEHGLFAGVILIPLEPKAFTRYYQQLQSAPDSIVALVGIHDRQLRARQPDLQGIDIWSQSLVSPLWLALKTNTEGRYQNISSIDQMARHYLYKTVPNLPLVMVTGFSNADVTKRLHARMRPITLALATAVMVVIVLTTMLSIIARQREVMKQLATTDVLTGLLNRRELMNIGEQEAARARRYHTSLSLLMLDIDHFKYVNDTWGHQTGDRALQSLAEVMMQVVREHDVVGRYGGEEFLILLPHTDAAAVQTVAERIRALVQSSHHTLSDNGEVVHFTVSIGVVTQSTDNTSLEDLISQADQALYKAKAQGRNRVAVASAL